VGLTAAAVVTRSLDSLLYGVAALDPLTFVAVPAIIALVGLVAGAVPRCAPRASTRWSRCARIDAEVSCR